jgi:hypothetical protein
LAKEKREKRKKKVNKRSKTGVIVLRPWRGMWCVLVPHQEKKIGIKRMLSYSFYFLIPTLVFFASPFTSLNIARKTTSPGNQQQQQPHQDRTMNNGEEAPAVTVDIDSPSSRANLPPPPGYSPMPRQHSGSKGGRKNQDADKGERTPLLGSGRGMGSVSALSPATGAAAAAAIRDAMPANGSARQDHGCWDHTRHWFDDMKRSEWNSRKPPLPHLSLLSL